VVKSKQKVVAVCLPRVCYGCCHSVKFGRDDGFENPDDRGQSRPQTASPQRNRNRILNAGRPQFFFVRFFRRRKNSRLAETLAREPVRQSDHEYKPASPSSPPFSSFLQSRQSTTPIGGKMGATKKIPAWLDINANRKCTGFMSNGENGKRLGFAAESVESLSDLSHGPKNMIFLSSSFLFRSIVIKGEQITINLIGQARRGYLPHVSPMRIQSPGSFRSGNAAAAANKIKKKRHRRLSWCRRRSSANTPGLKWLFPLPPSFPCINHSHSVSVTCKSYPLAIKELCLGPPFFSPPPPLLRLFRENINRHAPPSKEFSFRPFGR